MSKITKCLYICIDSNNGYGISAKCVIDALLKLKDVKVDVLYLNNPEFRNQKLEDEYDVAVNHTAPNNLITDWQQNGFMKMAMSRAKKKVQYILWETDRLPSPWAEFYRTNVLDGFICPSHFTEGLVSSFNKEVYYVPITQDEAVFSNDNRNDNKIFTVITVAQLSVRKAIDMSVCAFVNAFKDIPNRVKYVIKIGEKLDGTDLGQLIKGNIARSLLPNPGNIYTIENTLSEAELQGLYLNSHCYLHLSRGEGFGMTPLTAINHGLPVVYSDWSAHTEFLSLDRRSIPVEGEIDFAHSMDTRFGYEAGMKWFEVNVSESADALRLMYEKWVGGKLKFTIPDVTKEYREDKVIPTIAKLVGLNKVELRLDNKVDGITMTEV